jgi:hypothetical protein
VTSHYLEFRSRSIQLEVDWLIRQRPAIEHCNDIIFSCKRKYLTVMKSQHFLTWNSVNVNRIFFPVGAFNVKRQFKLAPYSLGKLCDSITPSSSIVVLHSPQSPVKTYKVFKIIDFKWITKVSSYWWHYKTHWVESCRFFPINDWILSTAIFCWWQHKVGKSLT